MMSASACKKIYLLLDSEFIIEKLLFYSHFIDIFPTVEFLQ